MTLELHLKLRQIWNQRMRAQEETVKSVYLWKWRIEKKVREGGSEGATLEVKKKKKSSGEKVEKVSLYDKTKNAEKQCLKKS